MFKVIPVPETSNTAAAILATELKKPFSNAFVKNRYVYRTFILPGQTARQKSVRRKLSPIVSEFKGKVVCIVDDSIVRGNTSREIVKLAKEAGASRVVLCSFSPEVTHPHVHGIDLADPAELVAHGRTREEIRRLIQSDELVFQSLDDLKDACTEAAGGDSDVTDFEVGVFCGKYKTEVPGDYFERRSNRLQESKKRKNAFTEDEENETGARKMVVVANSGPMNVAGPRKAADKGLKSPEHQEDVSIYNYANKA